MSTLREKAREQVRGHKDAADSLACCMDMVTREGKVSAIVGDEEMENLCALLLAHFADIARRLDVRINPEATNDELFEWALELLSDDEMIDPELN